MTRENVQPEMIDAKLAIRPSPEEPTERFAAATSAPWALDTFSDAIFIDTASIADLASARYSPRVSFLGRFFAQPNKKYRDFQLVFTLLTANFFFPAISYAVQPEIAGESVSRINEILGGGAYGHPGAEEAARFWRFLGAANVMTLALMCFLLQANLRRFYAVLIPLTFLKAYNASLFFLGWVFVPQHRAFLAISVFDFLTSAAFVFFSVRAHRSLGSDDSDLVPSPGWLLG